MRLKISWQRYGCMKEEKLFEALSAEKIPFVLIGGTALAAYGSERVTIDTDIAIETLDIDRIIELFYTHGLKMVTGVDANQFPELAKNADIAIAHAAQSNWGFLKFLSEDLELDVLYDIPVPFIRLLKEANDKRIFDINVKTASLNHLKIMKEKSISERDDEDKRRLDEIDLAFIEKKLNS